MSRTAVLTILASAVMLAHASAPNAAGDRSLGVIDFANNSARVPDDSRELIGGIVRWQTSRADSMLLIEGHASPPGTTRENLRLSQRRTDAVREALLQAGADPSRLVLIAQGEGRSRETTGSNRRVVIRGSMEFPDLAREQRDATTGEDAREAGRAMNDRRDAEAARGNANQAPVTIVVVPGTSTSGARQPPPVSAPPPPPLPGTHPSVAGYPGRTSGGWGSSAETGIGIDPTDTSDYPFDMGGVVVGGFVEEVPIAPRTGAPVGAGGAAPGGVGTTGAAAGTTGAVGEGVTGSGIGPTGTGTGPSTASAIGRAGGAGTGTPTGTTGPAVGLPTGPTGRAAIVAPNSTTGAAIGTARGTGAAIGTARGTGAARGAGGR